MPRARGIGPNCRKLTGPDLLTTAIKNNWQKLIVLIEEILHDRENAGII